MKKLTRPARFLPSVAALRRGFSVVLIGVFGLLATGCSLFGGSSPAPAPATTRATTFHPLVRIWGLNQGVDPLRTAIDDFQTNYPGVSVSLDNQPTTNYEFNSLKSMASAKGPDIWEIPSDWIGDYQDVLTPLPSTFFGSASAVPSQIVKGLYPAGIAEQITLPNGNVVGLPVNTDVLHLYINPVLIQKVLAEYKNALGTLSENLFQPINQALSSSPHTWSDLLKEIPYITRKDGNTITRSAIALGTADNIPNAQDILQLLMMQNGVSIISNDHRSAQFNFPQTTSSGSQVFPGVNALSFFTSFSDPSKASYTWNSSMPTAIDAFAQGKVAMVIAYSDFGKNLHIKYPSAVFTESPVPQIGPTASSVNLERFSVMGVTKTASSPTFAFKFLKNYTDPALNKAIADENKLHPSLTSELDGGASFLEPEIATGKTVYKFNYPQFDSIFHDMITDVTQNGFTPSQSASKGADKLNTILNSH